MKKLSKKLGELLVDAELAKWIDVDQALKAQKIFGGKLGTNLIEMGVLDGDTLADFLCRQFCLPRASRKELEEIQNDVLNLIPAKPASRLGILPVSKEGKTLILAMMDPSNEHAIDRVKCSLDVNVDVRVISEMELKFYHEKYYGIPDAHRHHLLMGQALSSTDTSLNFSREISGTVLTAQLDRHLTCTDAFQYYFEYVCSLDKVPVRNPRKDPSELDLTAELNFLLYQVDGISNLQELTSSVPFSRVSILRALIFFAKNDLLRFEEP